MDDGGNGNKTICCPEIEALKTKDSGDHKVFKHANNYRVILTNSIMGTTLTVKVVA